MNPHEPAHESAPEQDEAHDHAHDHDEPDAEIFAFWDAYCAASGTDPEADWDAFAFAGGQDDAAAADALAALVVAGAKRATTALLWEHEATDTPLPVPGDHHIILDAAGAPRAVVRTTQVEVLPICDVDEDFAAAEAEGDGSLAYWQAIHTRAFGALSRALGREPALDMPVVCERFELVYTGEAHA